jgi:peptide/nickel transport system ATP-binding protein
MALLEVKDLNIHLRTRRGLVRAVRDVSFFLERGQTLGLVGESGCGKSITALALMGLLPEQARVTGSVRLNGQELLGLPEAQLCKIRGDRVAMVFQEPMTALNPVHSIGDQVSEPLLLHRGLSRSAARAQAIRLLERVGIADAARRFDAYPHQFSGGQRQRITIAMALACEPDILIADEPTAALDVTLQKQILDLLRDLVQERGMALLLISHDLGVVAQNAARMMVMYGGSVLESGPTQRVFEHLAHPYTRGLLAARPRLLVDARAGSSARLTTIPGSVPELAELPAGCPFCGRCSLALAACAVEFPASVQLDAEHEARCIRLDALPHSGGKK